MSVIQLNNTAMAPKAIKVLLALHVISLFLYSPNYLSVVLPGVKYYILFVVGLSFVYVFVTGANISFNFMLFCLVFSLSLALPLSFLIIKIITLFQLSLRFLILLRLFIFA